MKKDQKVTASSASMLKIPSLLNPAGAGDGRSSEASTSPPTTPAYTTQTSSNASTPEPQTPSTPSASHRQKLGRDGAIFIRRTPQAPVNYPPFERFELASRLSRDDREELARQLLRFEVRTSDGDGMGNIANYSLRIPYASDRRTFTGKTHRAAFEAFNYDYVMGPGQKRQIVLWDHENGLVRITPFFKALGKAKTAPAKALNANPGLKELSHSITGGAIFAQGYWMPYECARAICLTFCYEIRWILTPIFGPDFVKQCLHPSHPLFDRYMIDGEIIQHAQLKANGECNAASSRHTTPISNSQARRPLEIPRSVPDPVIAGHQLRPRKERPIFREGSVFSSDSETTDRDYAYNDADSDSMALSPKSTPPLSQGSAWASVNGRRNRPDTTMSAASVTSGTLDQSLLSRPHYVPRPANRKAKGPHSSPRTVAMPTGRHDKHRAHKRRISEDHDADYADTPSHSLFASDKSENDAMDIDSTPITGKKRTRRTETPEISTPSPQSPATSSGSTRQWTDEDIDAAYTLLKLCREDDQIGVERRLREAEQRM